MNYIREINAFYDWLETNELSKSGILLWHALMHLNNRAGWIDTFAVARSTIEAKTGLRKDAYYNARNQLKQFGLIDFKERGNRASTFKIIPVSSVLQMATQTTTPTAIQTATQTITPTITKLNETKLNFDDYDDSARVVFEFYISEIDERVTPFIEKRISELIDNYTASAVHNALTEAVIYNARNLKYVETILKNSKGDNHNAKHRGRNERAANKGGKTDAAIYAELAASNAAWGGSSE